MSTTWAQWFAKAPDSFGSIPNILNTVALSNQNAAISATNFAGFVLPEGTYRASYYARITTVAGVSSSLTVTLAWTDGTVAQSFSGAAITGNTTTSYQSGSVVFRSDASAVVNYSTAYASNAASVMKYSLDLILERLRT
jgi:hypothetical protein